MEFIDSGALKWNSKCNITENNSHRKKLILNLGFLELILDFSILNKRKEKKIPKSMLWFLLICYYCSSPHFILSLHFTSDMGLSRHKSLGWITPSMASLLKAEIFGNDPQWQFGQLLPFYSIFSRKMKKVKGSQRDKHSSQQIPKYLNRSFNDQIANIKHTIASTSRP